MQNNHYRVIQADWNQFSDQLRALRYDVFVVEQSVPVELEWDNKDEQAVHVLALDDADRPLGTGRLLPNGQIGRMAVLKAFRGQGIGAALLEALLNAARQKQINNLFLNAQCTAIPFYSQQGFQPVGKIFLEAGIAHQRMELD